jgi:hypothetical protein
LRLGESRQSEGEASDSVRSMSGPTKPSSKRPVRRFLRGVNVTTVLTSAGIIISTAALLVFVGVGEVQIAASQHNNTIKATDNSWFNIGLVTAALGILVGVVAVAAISSQAAAKREFPDVAIRLLACEEDDARKPSDGGGFLKVLYVRLRVINRELYRNVSLSIHLRWDILAAEQANAAPEGARLEQLHSGPTTLTPLVLVLREAQGRVPIDQIKLPLQLASQTMWEGDVVFDIDEADARRRILENVPTVVFVDQHSDTVAEIKAEKDKTYDRE